MGLSSLFTHVLVLTGLNRPWGHSVQESAYVHQVPVLGATCWGPLMDRNLVVRSWQQEGKGQKEADIPWLMQKANKAPDTGLALFTEASGALSMEWTCKVPSREGLRSPGRKVNSESLCRAPRDQPEKEIEREREKDTGTRALMEQRCFNQHGVEIYTVLQGSYSQQR